MKVTDDDTRELFDRVRELWGRAGMFGQAQEECGELIVALSHLRRGRVGAEDEVILEVADVLIMATQLRQQMGTEDIDHAVKWKLRRLGDRVGREEIRRASGLPPRGDDGR